MPMLGGSPSNGTLPQPQSHASGLLDWNSFVPSPLQFNTVASTSTKAYQTGIDKFGYGRPDMNAAATAPSRASTLYPDESANQLAELRLNTGRWANSYSQA
jgi:hypothetical protein